MAVETFPSNGKLLSSAYSEKNTASVYRTQMESGPPKQARRQSMTLEMHQVTYLFSNADYISFKTWFHTTVQQGALWFNWTDPVDSVVKDARAVNGDFASTPINPQMTHWKVTMNFETYE